MKKLLYILLFLLAGLIQAQTINITNAESAVNITNNGADLISGWAFTSGWTTSNATINSATQFTATAQGGYIHKSAFFPSANKRYRLVASGTISSGTCIFGYMGTYITVSGAFDFDLALTSFATGVSIGLVANGVVVTITKMELRLKTSDYINVGN